MQVATVLSCIVERRHSAVPVVNNVVAPVSGEHRVVSCIQAEQAGRMRVQPQPLRRQNSQDMRMRDHDHDLASLHKRCDILQHSGGTFRGILQGFSRAIVDVDGFPRRQRGIPITPESFRKALRAVTPKHPITAIRFRDIIPGSSFCPAIIPLSQSVDDCRVVETCKSGSRTCPFQRTRIDDIR